ncbi:MAG: hypothetical protein ACYS8W_21410 [Planctomycetota bacterium]
MPRNPFSAASLVFVALLAGCAHIDTEREKTEHISDRETGRIRNESAKAPSIRIISRPTVESPMLELALVRRKSPTSRPGRSARNWTNNAGAASSSRSTPARPLFPSFIPDSGKGHMSDTPRT